MVSGKTADDLIKAIHVQTNARRAIIAGSDLRPSQSPLSSRASREMRDQHPTPETPDELLPAVSLPAHSMRTIAPWQRADRGDHQLHEHLKPERDARGRFARQESGRARPASRIPW